MQTVDFYFTHIISNSSLIDKCADFCLTPVHGLLRTAYGPKKVQIVRVHTDSKRIEELPLSSGGIVWKIAKFVVGFLFFIPGTILGAFLKGIAQWDDGVWQKNKMLEKSIQFLKHKLKKPTSDRLISFLDNAIFERYVLPFLSINDLLNTEKLSTNFWHLLNQNIPSKILKNYHKKFKGLEKKEDLTSLHSVCLRYAAHVRNFRYNSHLAEIFGGKEYIFQLPLFRLCTGQKIS